MKSIEEVLEYVNNSEIAGRYHRKNIRDYLRVTFPEEKGFVFKMSIIRKDGEITFQDFKRFINDGEDIPSE